MKLKIVIALFFVLFCSILQAQPVNKNGQLKVVGTKLCNANGQPIALHGMSFGWHNLWPRFYNKGAVHELVAKWHCTVIRASMGIELNAEGYLQNPKQSVKLMSNVIDACIKEGVYVIIDWHDHNIHLKEAKEFFTLMAKKYAKYPNIIYELYNEPDYETWPQVKTYCEELVKIIRAEDASNIILVGCPKWDQDINLPAADPIMGYNNLMYTMHFYAGTHKKWLREKTDAAIKSGLAVFVSECAGMEASGDGPIDMVEWNAFKTWMDNNTISWAAWSVSDKKETCSILNPSAASKGKWKEEDIKEWGKTARAALATYANVEK